MKQIEQFEHYVDRTMKENALNNGQVAALMGVSYRRMYELRSKGTYVDANGQLYRRTGIFFPYCENSGKSPSVFTTARNLEKVFRDSGLSQAAASRVAGLKHRSTFKAILDRGGAIVAADTKEILTIKKQKVTMPFDKPN
ncbi:hypothetical protein [Salinivibrio sp. SS2]|uniref:hypothetical protein n=1 Tax=Salinivibrio sp. SS2 TaxID=1892894 RepID=UPI00084BC7F5|nr:hypothetical protein [Salinivibrio sp. DV]ODQ00622.1 hypothetical protein BGK46_06115 [Salinivibrio sp. DV]